MADMHRESLLMSQTGIRGKNIRCGMEPQRHLPGEHRRSAVCNHYHLWVKRLLKDGADVRALTGQLLLEHPDCIIISDEIGNGIVPMEHEEREYRELTRQAAV